MPTFTTLEQQNINSSTRGPLIGQDLAGRVGESFDILGRGIRSASNNVAQAGKNISEFAQNMQRAEDVTAVNNARRIFNEDIAKKLNELETRNDFENFEKEINDSFLSSRSRISTDVPASKDGKNNIDQILKDIESTARIELDSVINRKRIAYFETSYENSRLSAVRDGDLPLANNLTVEAFDNHIINDKRKAVDIQKNTEEVNFYAARDHLDQFPDDIDPVLNAFPVNRENTDALKRYASSLIEKRRKEKRENFDAFMVQELANPDFSLPQIEQVLNTIHEDPDNVIDPKGVETYRNLFREKAAIRDKTFIQDGYSARMIRIEKTGDFDMETELELLQNIQERGAMSETQIELAKNRLTEIETIKRKQLADALIFDIKRLRGTNLISNGQAQIELLDILAEFPASVDISTAQKALAEFKDISQDTEDHRKMLKRYSQEVLDSFPPGSFGELYGDTVKKSKENYLKIGERIQGASEKDRVKLLRAFAEVENERLKHRRDMEDFIEDYIRLHPRSTREEIREAILKRSAAQLEKEAFRQGNILWRALKRSLNFFKP